MQWKALNSIFIPDNEILTKKNYFNLNLAFCVHLHSLGLVFSSLENVGYEQGGILIIGDKCINRQKWETSEEVMLVS